MKENIVKEIEKMSGQYTPYQIFSDWVAMLAISIQNACWEVYRGMRQFDNNLWQDRERRYLNIASRYTKEQMMIFCKMSGWLTDTYEQAAGDILGEIYMESGCGNKATGQFFTPFQLSQLCSDIAFSIQPNKYGDYIINEPSCGGGGMIIAALNTMKSKNIDWRKAKVVAQDLDWNGVYMTYVQLSLLGIDAIVAQGDTLKEPYKEGYPPERTFYTPVRMGLII